MEVIFCSMARTSCTSPSIYKQVNFESKLAVQLANIAVLLLGLSDEPPQPVHFGIDRSHVAKPL
eukprot:765251-Hanusia_phi.AAC.3